MNKYDLAYQMFTDDFMERVYRLPTPHRSNNSILWSYQTINGCLVTIGLNFYKTTILLSADLTCEDLFKIYLLILKQT